MARNTLKLNLSGFEELITKLEGLDGDVKKTVTKALEQTAKTIEKDTQTALNSSNLPRGGKYSTGDTKKAVVTNATAIWSGTQASINVGFDYGKKGAGGFLITGTPRMKPVTQLKKMYKGATYRKRLQNDMSEIVQAEIKRKMGG
jgi:hypothetical protein